MSYILYSSKPLTLEQRISNELIKYFYSEIWFKKNGIFEKLSNKDSEGLEIILNRFSDELNEIEGDPDLDVMYLHNEEYKVNKEECLRKYADEIKNLYLKFFA